MQTSEAQDSSTIDCCGLSTALTLLRIKQAVTAPKAAELPLSVSVDSSCDCLRLTNSLGELAEDIRLMIAKAA